MKTLKELENKYFGKVGTKSRREYEKQVKKVIECNHDKINKSGKEICPGCGATIYNFSQ